MARYKEIADDIRNQILSGKYNINAQLPLEKEMCVTYNVSRITVKKAVDELVGEGLVIKRRGSGTFVKAIDESTAEDLTLSRQFSGFTDSNKGKKIKSKILTFEVVHPSSEIAGKLQIEEDDFTYYIVRVRYADDEPVVVEYTYMPIGVIPGIKTEVLNNSIYAYIEGTLKLKIKSAHRTVRAILPNEIEQENLEIDKYFPILEVEQVGFLDNGVPFEYSKSHHRSDKSEFKSVSLK